MEGRLSVTQGWKGRDVARMVGSGAISQGLWIAEFEVVLAGFEGRTARVLADMHDSISHPLTTTFVDFVSRARSYRIEALFIALFGVSDREGLEKMGVIRRVADSAGLPFEIQAFNEEDAALSWLTSL